MTMPEGSTKDAAGGTPFIKKRAPTLYFIIGMKLVKGTALVALAVVLFKLADNDLPAELHDLLEFLKIDPEKRFWSDLAVQIGRVTETNVIWVGVGTVIYSLFSWVEGIGLMFRASWAGWLAIGESAFFIPIEVLDLLHNFSWVVLVILGLNILIVWYLFVNRHWLFRHHHHHH
jgi:uncharacterized membrane protein (DUF2068 family)